MFEHRRWPFALGIALLLSAVTVSNAQDGKYVPLFDGKDLTGWRYGKSVLHRAGETLDKRFSVSGGNIVQAARDKDGKKTVRNLTTVRDFSRDFVLKLEFKAAQESIGSVVVRGAVIPIGDFVRRNEQRGLKKFQTDGWNELEVTVKMTCHADGKRLKDSDRLEASFQNGKAQATLNGQTIDPNRIVVQTEAIPRINGEAHIRSSYGASSKGNLSLRTGNGKIEFRNIRFRELP